MNINQFKTVVGKYPTGIIIVSTKYNNQLYGLTANSFTSVSLNPFLVSFCLDVKSFSFNAFYNTKHFTINILSIEQEELANLFASRSVNKFQNINFTDSSIGLPLIDDVLSWIECENYKQLECGDHYIFIGKALKATINNNLSPYTSPLVYYQKSYKAIT